MTESEYLDNCNKRWESVYRCKQCDFRATGSAVEYHERDNPGHEVYREPWLTEPNPDTFKDIQKS